jgi:hypothetical protein
MKYKIHIILLIAVILNFSSEISGMEVVSKNNADEPDACQEVARRWMVSKVAINNLVAQPVGVQPMPPAFERFCLGENDYQERDAKQEQKKEEWYESYLKKEKTLAEQSIASAKAWILCNENQAEINQTEVNKHLKKLAEFAGESALKLATQVEGSANLDFYIPTVKVLVQVSKTVSLLGGSGSEKLLEKAGDLFNELVEDLLKQIKLKHDFRYSVATMTELVKDATMLGNDSIDVSEVFERYTNAMTFNIELNNQTYLEDFQWQTVNQTQEIHYDLIPKDHWEPFPMQFKLDFEAEVEDGEMTQKPKEFESQYWINIKACEQKPIVEVFLSYLGPEEESFQICDEEGVCQTIPLPMGGLHAITYGNLKDDVMPVERYGIPFYRFELPLRNLNTELTNETIEGSYEDGTETEYKIKLTHTPK